MLQLVLGRSGSGKTQWIYERLSALVDTEEDRPLLCVVPEQFSFETERSLLEALGPHRAARIQVLSFTRMAETVFRSTGGFAGRRLDDSSRMLLMSRALEMTAGQLSLYTRHTADPEYISSMLSMLSELKQCAVTPLALEKTAKALPKGTLAMKAQELSLIYGAYEALLGHTYLDPLDDLTRLAEVLPESGLLKGALLFVDAFKGFTAQEMQVLSALLNIADTVTVTLCTDTLDDTAQGLGRFSPVIPHRAAARAAGAAAAYTGSQTGCAFGESPQPQRSTSPPRGRKLSAGRQSAGDTRRRCYPHSLC